eukprot:scpid97142/ scgid10889/ 
MERAKDLSVMPTASQFRYLGNVYLLLLVFVASTNVAWINVNAQSGDGMTPCQVKPTNVKEISPDGNVTCTFRAFKNTSSPLATCNPPITNWMWSGTCQNCTIPSTFNGSIKENGMVICNPGYVQTATGGVTASCTDRKDANTDWIGFGQCQAVCSLPQIDNSQSVNGSGYSRDGNYTSYLVTCEAGFYLSNLNYPMNCTSAGGAFAAVPTCEACNHTNLDGVEKVDSNGTVTCRYDTFKATASGPAMCNAS